MMLMHAGQPLSPHDLWNAWSVEPGVVIPLVATAALYARGIRQAVARSTRARITLRREELFFAAGLAVLAIALVSPLHSAGGVLFSAHMIQHELLMAIAAPLIVLGRPAVPLLWGLPRSIRKPVAKALTRNVARSLWSTLTRPLVAFMLHAAAIWIWHAPSLYDASVTSELVHTAQHLSFLFTAFLFWWSLLSPRRARGQEGAAVLYLFLTGIHTTLLGALLTVSDSPLYSAYLDSVTRQWGLTALEDQQLGGIIMWVPAGVVYLTAALYLMLKWIRASGLRTSARDLHRAQSLAAQAARGAAMVAIAVLALGCSDRDAQWAAEMTGGTPSRGKTAIRSYGCQSCHSIPGVTGASALVGPPLRGVASRSYIAGVMSNTPTHMIEWLRNPPAIDAKTAMPNMHVSERDARDIAAYLYTLR
jgi:cytochrome c oxidase assembly factor CtaG/cytochrome c2